MGFFNNPELDAVVERYWPPDAHPTINAVRYMLKVEKDEEEKRISALERQKAKSFEAGKRAEEITAAAERRAALLKERDTLPYSEVVAQRMCERISAGELLINICSDDDMPTLRQCNNWLSGHGDFNMLYQSALNDRLGIFEEEVIKISDESARDFDLVTMKNGSEKRVLDPARVTSAKLRIEVRFRHLRAMRPAKWGDVSTLVTKSEDPNDTANLSNDELERRIADIELKDRTFKMGNVA
jgi:hypothetical protein